MKKSYIKKFSGSLFFLVFGHQNPVSVFHPDSLEMLDPYYMNLVHSNGGIEGPPSLPHPPSVIQNNTLIVDMFFQEHHPVAKKSKPVVPVVDDYVEVRVHLSQTVRVTLPSTPSASDSVPVSVSAQVK